MNLHESLLAMNSTAMVRGVSDGALVDQVGGLCAQQYPDFATKPELMVAAGLGGAPLAVRPLDALLRLSRLTAPRVSEEVYDVYRHWGWLRYLGAFQVDEQSGALTLTRAALDVAGNQRRVLSEELGLGFGAVFSEYWCRALGVRGQIGFCDIDQIINGVYPGPRITSVAKRMPDYLLQYTDPQNAKGFAYRALECKGTVRAAHAPYQLARAMTQLASLRVDGAPVQGVGTAVISGNAELSFMAVDPAEDVPHLRTEGFDLGRARSEKSRPKWDGPYFELKGEEFLAAATAVAIGSLADFAGEVQAAKSWLPSKITRDRSGERETVVREGEDGEFIGREEIFPAPGANGSLIVFQGVERRIAHAIRSLDIEEVGAAQFAWSESKQMRMRESNPLSVGDPERTAHTSSSEGAYISLKIVT